MSGDPTDIPSDGPRAEKVIAPAAPDVPVGAEDRREWFHSMRSWWDAHAASPAAEPATGPTPPPTAPKKPASTT